MVKIPTEKIPLFLNMPGFWNNNLFIYRIINKICFILLNVLAFYQIHEMRESVI